LSTAELNIDNSFSLRKLLNVFLELAKIRITIFVAFTASIGYLLAAGVFNTQMLWATLGVFLLASGSSALNHVQERRFDALMKRTMNRPIPNGDISARGALLYSLSLIALGSVVLIFATNLISLALGIATLVWYNAIYTPLKRKNSLAIFPRIPGWCSSTINRLGCYRKKHIRTGNISFGSFLFYLADPTFLDITFTAWR
jgi:heme O synthase-like polyprenyltransferase